MTGLAKVVIEKKNGALGGITPSNDGEALLIINLPPANVTAIGGSVFSFTNYKDFAAAIPAQEISTSALRFESHVKSFFEASSSKLHLFIVPDDSMTLVNIFNIANGFYASLSNYIRLQNGAIKLIGVAFNSVSVITTVPTLGVTADLQNGIAVVQAFAALEFVNGRPVDILIEGKKVNPLEMDLLNLRTKAAPNVSVVAWQHKPTATYLVGSTPTNNFMAELGYTLGLVSAQGVHINVGRVRNGRLKYNSDIAFSNGTLVQDVAKATLDTAAEKAYMFAVKHPQLDGYYLSDDPTATLKTDDYSWITRNRSINKAARITRRVFNDRILDAVYTDPDTGLLSALTIKNFESEVEQAISLEMIRVGELTAVEAYVNPDQDVLTTGEIVIDIRVIPVGVARYIIAKIGFTKVI